MFGTQGVPMIEETMFNSEDKFSMNGARGDVVRRRGEQRAINSILKLVARLLYLQVSTMV